MGRILLCNLLLDIIDFDDIAYLYLAPILFFTPCTSLRHVGRLGLGGGRGRYGGRASAERSDCADCISRGFITGAGAYAGGQGLADAGCQ